MLKSFMLLRMFAETDAFNFYSIIDALKVQKNRTDLK